MKLKSPLVPVVPVASVGVKPVATTFTVSLPIGLPALSTTRYCTEPAALGATTAGTSVAVIVVPRTCTKVVLVMEPETAVTVMTRMARLSPVLRVPVTLPPDPVLAPETPASKPLSTLNEMGTAAKVLRDASTAVAVTVTVAAPLPSASS